MGEFSVDRFLTSDLAFIQKCSASEDKEDYTKLVFLLKAKRMFPSPDIKSTEETHVTPSHLQLFLNLAFLISQNDSRLEEADAVNYLIIFLFLNFNTEKIEYEHEIDLKKYKFISGKFDLNRNVKISIKL